MKKEGLGNIFNSQDGKVNLVLLFSVVLIFLILGVFLVYGLGLVTVVGDTPVTGTISASRNVNFTFTPTWVDGPVGNCTLWSNISGAWLQHAEFNGTEEALVFNQSSNITNGTTSWINFTFGQDAYFVWSVGCRNGTGLVADVNVYNITFSTNLTVYVDVAAPLIVQTVDIFQNFNTTSTTPTITFNFTDYNGTGVNITGSGNTSLNLSIYNVEAPDVDTLVRQYNASNDNLTCSPTGQAVQAAQCTVAIGSSTFGLSNGTKNITIGVVDRAGGNASFTSSFLITVDQIPPVIGNITITNGTVVGQLIGVESIGSSDPSTVPDSGAGTWAQGLTMNIFANVSDNLTSPLNADLQFFNETSGNWQTVNTTLGDVNHNITTREINTNGSVNFTFTPTAGRGVFEGHNVTFRILVNDTLGNKNANGSNALGVLMNITVQINDTTKPTITVTIETNNTLNNSNTSDATPTVHWNVSEGNALKNLSIQFDSFTAADAACVGYTLYTGAVVENKRNGSVTLKGNEDEGGCSALANGTHTVRVTAEDVWGNSELYIHQFGVQSGKPGIIFNGVTRSDGLSVPPGFFSNRTINNTNISRITSLMGINFSVNGLAVNVQNLTYITSCNPSSVKLVPNISVTNSTVIFPFNESTCPTTSANQTITVTVNDNVGSSNTTVFGFTVDNVGPTVTVNSPTAGQRFAGIGNVSVTVVDSEGGVDTIGVYLDGSDQFRNHSSNGSSKVLVNGTGIQFIANSTLNNSLGDVNVGSSTNLSAGTHTIKISVNDTLGNVANSSIIIFVVDGPINFASLGLNGTNGTLISFNTNFTIATDTSIGGDGANITLVNLTNASGEPLVDTRTVTDQTLKLFMALNTSRRSNTNGNGNTNVTIVFNASAANWGLYNFTVRQNDSASISRIEDNWTVNVQQLLWFNQSIRNFLPNNNSYYAKIRYPVNSSQYSIGSNFEIWFFEDINDFTNKVNITECDSDFDPSFTFTSATACWNSSNGTGVDKNGIDIFVPHFSVIAFVNDSDAPWVNVTTPAGNSTTEVVSNHSVSMFLPNITVSRDAVSCFSSLNGTVTNATMKRTSNVCIGQTERFKSGGAGYNFSFWVIDSKGNTNRYIWNFTVTDTTKSNTGAITSSASTTTADVTISNVNESVNATVLYHGDQDVLNGSQGGTLLQAEQSDFNKTQVVSISGLTGSTTYYYNVTLCDFSENCIVNGTRSFTTSAAAAAAAASSSSSSSSSGGGGAVPVSNTVASAGRVWDSLAAGSSAAMNVNNVKIAITGITVNVKNEVTKAELTVESFNSNPLTSAAAAQVYQYLQIIKKNIADTDTSSITISFKVPKSWLATNGVAEANVVLYRFKDSKWNPLPTTMTGSDTDNVLYEATTPGFSTFAIGSTEAAPVEAPTEEEAGEETPGEEAVPTGEVPTDLEPAVPPLDGPKSKAPIAWIVVLVIVVVAAVGYYMMQKKKEQY